MKASLFICMLCLPFSGFCQTDLIAHKSHSGTMDIVHFGSSDGGFGLPSFLLDSIVKINDSTAVEFLRLWEDDRLYRTDTIVNHPYCLADSVELSQLLKYKSIKVIGFDNKTDSTSKIKRKEKSVKDGEKTLGEKKETLPINPIPSPPSANNWRVVFVIAAILFFSWVVALFSYEAKA